MCQQIKEGIGLAVTLNSVEAHESVTAMVEAYAAQAVTLARKFKSALDFSENSVMELETILEALAQQTPEHSADSVSEACKTWGSYLVEVVRRHFGGEWTIETYPGKQFATLTLNVNGSKLFPTMKVHRRLTEGNAENVWLFYKMVKARLQSSASTRIH